MRLELGTFPVHQARFGPRTRWADGVLEINHAEVLELVRSFPNVAYASVDLAHPGESVRINNYTDVVEPRVKVEGPGVTYPGLFGRSVATVGSGRTHRLGGFCVAECTPFGRALGGFPRISGGEESQFGNPVFQSGRRMDFCDMSGPGATRPQSALINLVIYIEPIAGLDGQDRHVATHGATLRVVDYLANAVAQLDPPEVEVFDLSQSDPNLPGVVFIPVLASFELWGGPDSKAATAVYGVTRLSAPWVLNPTELLDGAVSQDSGGGQGLSWAMTNNPLALQLMRRHGKDLNFVAVIVHRSNWGGQTEMELAAYRDAQVAKLLGAKGAFVTTDIRGRRFVDAVAAVRACMAEGIKTVLITEEEDVEDGNATPLLINDPAIQATISTGNGYAGPFPAVDRVLGEREPEPASYSALPAIPGRYGAFYLQDYYGYGRQGCVDF